MALYGRSEEPHAYDSASYAVGAENNDLDFDTA